MNKNALKENRRETVISLLKGMTIKKDSNGGFDKEDVYGCIQELCNLYEAHIEELEGNYEFEINELTKKCQKYDDNNELYMSIIMEAKKTNQQLIEQAQEEVKSILNKAKEDVAIQERNLEQFKQDSERQQKVISAELEARKEEAEAEKAAIKLEIEEEKEKLEIARNKFRQQISSMEREFDEIRTNILRTATSLNTLKAQTEDVETETEWKVIDDLESVQIPQPDLTVEDTIDIEPQQGTLDSFEDMFFRSEILDQIPAKPETPIEEPIIASEEDLAFLEKSYLDPIEELIEEPVYVEPAAEPLYVEPAVEPVYTEPVAEPTYEAPAAQPAHTQMADELPPIDNFYGEVPAEIQDIEMSVEDLLAAMTGEQSAKEAATETPEFAQDVESLLEELSFDGLQDEVPPLETNTEEIERIIEEIDEISFDGIEEIVAGTVAEQPPEQYAETAIEEIDEIGEDFIAEQEEASEEISFEGLAELFKDER